MSTIAEMSFFLNLCLCFCLPLFLSLCISQVIQVALEAWKQLPQSFILAAYIACRWLTLDEALKNLRDLGSPCLKGGELKKGL